VEAAGDDVLGALRAGRVAISVSPEAPVVLRHEDDVLVLDAEGALLIGPEEAARPIVSRRVRVPAGPGPYRVIDGAGQTLALSP
jgi:hypothetical protein